MHKVEWSPVSNRGAWSETLRLAKATDLPGPTLTEIEMAIGRKDGSSPLFTKTLSGGDISYDSATALMSWVLPESVMRTLCPGTYRFGVTVTMSGVEEQFIVGSLPVVDGVVS